MKLYHQEKYRLNKDSVITVCIIILPFAFYLYNFSPRTPSWKNSIFEINSGVFEDVNHYLWQLSVKLLTVLILTLWYITCKQKWRNVLLIPIVFEVYKFFTIVKGSKIGQEIVGITFIETICYSTPFIIFILFISKKLNYYNRYHDSILLNEEITNQILKSSKFDSKQYKSLKKELKNLDAQKGNLEKKEYLTKLIALRDQLTISV